MSENDVTLSEQTSLKDSYPVLVGFSKAILPDTDVAINIEKPMFEEKYASLLVSGANIATTDRLPDGSLIGTMIMIHYTKEHDGVYTVIGRSLMRVKLEEISLSDGIYYAKLVSYPYEKDCDDDTIAAYANIISTSVTRLASGDKEGKIYKEIPPFFLQDPDRWINSFGPAFKNADTNLLFYAKKLSERLEHLAVAIGVQLDRYKIKEEIEKKIQDNIEKSQREYYLREELKVVNEELYGSDDERAKYENAIAELNASDEVKDKLTRELNKMMTLQAGSPESFVSKNYIDTVLALPWGKFSEENRDIKRAREVLEEDHYGIQDVKDRIIEYLVVHNLSDGNVTNILCLVGPPGVGKTSIAASIARALGRKYVRASLGGVHDEAEIRGHRRTYIGSMPGRIIAGIKNAGTSNPVFLLDEIDKLGADYKGDPSNALLEVLDPAQNSTYQDHYIDLPFDLSKVMFITTANTLQTMSKPLLDRMEIIELGSYLPEEKHLIAVKFLIPKQLNNYHLSAEQVSITDAAIDKIIRFYTREAGVRRLEQLIGKILRKAAVAVVEKDEQVLVDEKDVEEYLGIPKFTESDAFLQDRVGVVHGLAWTENGGEMLDVESLLMKGKDKKIVTGNLGNVMKESVEIALSNAREYATEKLGKEIDLSEKDLHVHFPDGAVPKDGPSAGCAISTAILSTMLGTPVKGDYAITGELSLVGRVIPIGGVKEKCVAALRNGIKKVILPAENKKDVTAIPETLREQLQFTYVERIEEVYKILLGL
ncbi:MAG: endopeptidase La [Clostridia bacterium]|nr:endopeptidase La [Clostridia bacterium]